MISVIAGVLDAPMREALEAAAQELSFEDGKATAGRYARDVKTNQQAAACTELDEILETARARIWDNEIFQSVARPKRVARMLLSRYRSGMEYGTHVDDPVMQGHRTDLSFTLPLSAPEEYDGGGLVIDDGLEERVIRLQAGDMVLYPTSALHRVEPVTRGARVAIVGWITSRVRDPARREVLHDLDLAARASFEAGGKTPGFDRLLKAKSNLYRMWAED